MRKALVAALAITIAATFAAGFFAGAFTIDMQHSHQMSIEAANAQRNPRKSKQKKYKVMPTPW